ncbi:MAG: PorT family protein [Tannerellaceae bacterium]|nr:PorT family protein [Tannerellaceae bacterium]
MKARIIFSVFVCSLMSVMSMNAQTKASVGIKLNGNLTNVKLTDMQSDNKFKAGGSVGGFVLINFSEHFALQPELLFNYTETSLRILGEKTKYKYAGVEIPVYALGKYKVGKGHFLQV